MSSTILLKAATIVNEGQQYVADILIKNGIIDKISSQINPIENSTVYNLEGKFVLPGCIDDQVHFREPGLTHKATIASEARAAVAGGVTSFMEMPNVIPPTLNLQLLEEKFAIAAHGSLANHSFFLGVSNDKVDGNVNNTPNINNGTENKFTVYKTCLGETLIKQVTTP